MNQFFPKFRVVHNDEIVVIDDPVYVQRIANIY